MKKAAGFGFVILLTVLLALGFAGCSNPSGSDTGSSGDGGIFTMNGIPSTYNGQYATLGLLGSASVNIGGAQSYSYNAGVTTTNLVQISNESVSLPMWILTPNLTRYTGNDTVNVVFIIYNTPTFKVPPGTAMPSAEMSYSVSFSNGNATKSWSTGTQLLP